jgi:hypothetical protein
MKAAVYNTFNGAIEIKQEDDFVVTETEAIIGVRVEKPLLLESPRHGQL